MSTETTAPASTTAMAQGRRADSARRRQRVPSALNDAVNHGAEITVNGVASRAGVDRTFLYRHRDLLEQVHAAEAQPPDAAGIGPAVSRASLQADLLAAQHRSVRMAARIQQLEARRPSCSASRPGANPDSAHPRTSTSSNSALPSSNKRPSTCGYNWRNATKNVGYSGKPAASCPGWPTQTRFICVLEVQVKSR